eukprot:403346022
MRICMDNPLHYSIKGILIFLLVLANNIINRESKVVFKQEYSTLYNKNIYQLNQSNFDIAVGVQFYDGKNHAEEKQEIQKYLTFVIDYMDLQYFSDNNGSSYVKREVVPYVLGSCTNDRFIGQENEMSLLGLNKPGFFCPQNFTMDLKGKIESIEKRMIRVRVFPCQNTTTSSTCKSAEQIKSTMMFATINVAFINSYFDEDEFAENPVKHEIKQFFYNFNFNQSYSKLMNIQKSHVVTKDNWISALFSNQQYNFYSMGHIDNTVGIIQPSLFEMFQITIYQANQEVYVDRQVLSLIDILSTCGGFANIIILVSRYLCLFFAKHLYYQSLFKKIFKVQKQKSRSINKNNSSTKYEGLNFNDSTGMAQDLYDFKVKNNPKQTKYNQDSMSNTIKNDSSRSVIHKSGKISSDQTVNLYSNSISNKNDKKFFDMLLKSFKSRIRPKFNVITIILDIVFCRKDKYRKDLYMYNQARYKYENTVDIVQLVKSVRNIKFMQKVLLKKYQRKFLQEGNKNSILQHDLSSACKQINQKKIITFVSNVEKKNANKSLINKQDIHKIKNHQQQEVNKRIVNILARNILGQTKNVGALQQQKQLKKRIDCYLDPSALEVSKLHQKQIKLKNEINDLKQNDNATSQISLNIAQVPQTNLKDQKSYIEVQEVRPQTQFSKIKNEIKTSNLKSKKIKISHQKKSDKNRTNNLSDLRVFEEDDAKIQTPPSKSNTRNTVLLGTFQIASNNDKLQQNKTHKQFNDTQDFEEDQQQLSYNIKGQQILKQKTGYQSKQNLGLQSVASKNIMNKSKQDIDVFCVGNLRTPKNKISQFSRQNNNFVKSDTDQQ